MRIAVPTVRPHRETWAETWWGQTHTLTAPDRQAYSLIKMRRTAEKRGRIKEVRQIGGVKTTTVSVLRWPLGCRTADHCRGSLPCRHKPVSRLRLHPFVSKPPPCSQVFGLFIIQHFHTVFWAMSTTYLQHWFYWLVSLSNDFGEDALCFGHQVLILVPASHPKKS